MRAKTTRRALFVSALSLIMCASMLIGTTFAWFTDSVTSGRNNIKSGKLDVVLEYWDGNDYVEVTPSTKLFNDAAKWEPGYTEVAYLKVSNAGTLALKYQLGVNVYNEIIGKTKTDADIKLSDYLVFSVVDKQITSSADLYTREQAVTAAGNALGIDSYNSGTKALNTNSAADYIALIIYMPTTVDNAANHNGVNIPSIELGVNLVATQQTYEEDSFDNQYDKDAKYDITVSNTAELIDALTAGNNVTLADDIDLTASASNGNFEIPAAAGEVKINLNGNTIIAPAREGYTGRTQYALDNYADLTITGNGTIISRGIQNYGTLTIEEGVTVVAKDTAGGAAVYAYAGSNTIINGATLTATNNAACVITYGDLTINGGTFEQTGTTGKTYAIILNGDNASIANATVTGVHGCVCVNAGTATIESGSYTCTGVVGQSDHVAYVSNATLTINGGNFVGDHDAGGKCVYEDTNGTATINGGTFTDR